MDYIIQYLDGIGGGGVDSIFGLGLTPPPPAPPLCQAVFMSSVTVNLLPGWASLSTVVFIVGG